MRLTLVVILLVSPLGVAAAEGPAALKVAAPGLSAPGVDPKIAGFFSDHLAQQLAHRGLAVTTATEISTLLGVERQRQLLGCSDCQVELGNALGVRAILQGQLSRGASGGYTLDARLADVETGAVLAQASRSSRDEEQLLRVTAELAGELAATVLGAGSTQSVGSLGHFEDRLNVLSTGPLHMLGSYFGVDYERVVSELFSVFVAPQYLANQLSRGFEVTIGARVYPFGDAPRGMYVGPFAVGGYGTSSFSTGEVTGPGLGLGAELGYQWLIADRVAVAVGFGHGYRPLAGYLRWMYDSPQMSRLRLHVGVAF